jgi:hypothetical protein
MKAYGREILYHSVLGRNWDNDVEFWWVSDTIGIRLIFV